MTVVGIVVVVVVVVAQLRIDFFQTSSICFLEKCSKEKCFSGDHWSGKKVIRPRSDESEAAFKPLSVFFYAHIVNQALSGSASPSCSLSRFALARFFSLLAKHNTFRLAIEGSSYSSNL